MITQHLRKFSIFKRLNISFLGLLIGTAVFLTFFSYSKYLEEVVFNLERYASMYVQNVRLKVQDILEGYEGLVLPFYEDEEVLHAVAENEALSEEESDRIEENRRKIEKKLFQVGMGRKHVKNIQLVTKNYQYHMSDKGYQRGGTIQDLQQFYDSELYRAAIAKHGYPVWIEDREQNRLFYESEQSVYGMSDIITLAIAVYAPDTREFLGVFTMNVDIKAFETASRGYEMYQDGNLFLIGEDGVLLGFHPSIAFPSFPSNTDVFQTMQEKKQAVVHTNFEGKEVLFAYENIADTEMFSVYISDMDRLLSQLRQTRNRSILVLITVVISCFAISYFVTKSIADPIRKLIQVMGKAGDGKWTVRYQNSGNDEITMLGDRFNEMADKTNQLIEQVYVSEIRRQKMQLSWKNAQLDAMLMQINPHFLYNTLDIIRWEAMYEANGESRVTHMIEQFSQLCRMGMKAGGMTISLKESLEHAKVYLDVINFRHQEKVEVDIHVSEHVEQCYVPQFMLQPILENAVVHGFSDGSKGYKISIEAKIVENTLKILVEDNGKGMEEEELYALQTYILEEETPEKSIGIVNVNQRIRLFYGEDYGVQIQSEHGEGTKVIILLPVRFVSENMKMINEEEGNNVPGFDC